MKSIVELVGSVGIPVPTLQRASLCMKVEMRELYNPKVERK